MDKVIAQIFETKEYQKFVNAKRNREDGQKTVTLTNALRGQAHPYVPPIEVAKEGDKFVVYDGWHRFNALRNLKLPVQYFVSYAKNYDTTKGMVDRNRSKKWTFDNKCFSYSKSKIAEVADRYQELIDTLNMVQNKAGKLSRKTLAQLMQGYNLALDQSNGKDKAMNYSKIDAEQGYFKFKDKEMFLKVLDRFLELQSSIKSIRYTVPMTRAFFTLLCDDDVKIKILADGINSNFMAFEAEIAKEQDNAKCLNNLVNLYNGYALGKSPLISGAMGVHGYAMKGKNFHYGMFLTQDDIDAQMKEPVYQLQLAENTKGM